MLRASAFVALFHGKSVVTSMTLTDAITFTGLTHAAIAFLSLFSWYEVMDSVYSGAVSSDMLEPLNYFNYYLAQDIGRAFASFLLRGVPITIGYAILFDNTLPRTISQWLAFTLVLILSWLISFSWRILVNLASFVHQILWASTISLSFSPGTYPVIHPPTLLAKLVCEIVLSDTIPLYNKCRC